MQVGNIRTLALAAAAAGMAMLGACSKQQDATPPPANTAAATAAATSPANMAAPAAPVATKPAGFDPATAPEGRAPPGAWPYFSLIDGYEPLSLKNKPGDASREYEKDVAFDRYEIFDGSRIVPVEGRLYTVKALGKGASFFQVQKTYEKLVHDLGGVTVFEGSSQAMADAKIKFSDQRQRAKYGYDSDKVGVYMIRLHDGRKLWVETWRRWEDSSDDSYWLTVVETKPLEVKAKLLDAEQMKAALDAQGHVALYINFDTDKTAIRPESQPMVGEVVKLLNANPTMKLEVQGHTDNAGTPPHNQTLSEGRAGAVVGALIAQGVAAGRLTPRGYGQTKPIADNGSEDGRARNRRVELVKR